MTHPIYELGDLVTIRKGKKALDVSKSPSEGFLRYIQIEDLRNNDSMKYARNPKGPICDESDVLIAWDGAKAGTVGFGLSGLVGSTIAILKLNDSIHAPYLGRVLQSKYQLIRDACTGATIPHVSKQFLIRMKIPLPSIIEQKRIASILHKTEKIKSSSEIIPYLRQKLILSIFNEMFGDLRINSMSWPEHSISELCNRVNVGFVGPLTPLYVENGIRCLRGLNIKRGKISSENIKQISPVSHENLLKKSRLNAGDVVAIRTGNAGVSAVITEEYDDVNCADLIIMTPTSKIEASYLCEFINQKFGDADSIQGVVGAIQKHFNIGSVKKVMIPLPPLELQTHYTKFLNTISNLDVQTKLSENTNLSLNQELLT